MLTQWFYLDSQSRGFLKTGINDEEEKSAGFLKNLYTKFFRESKSDFFNRMIDLLAYIPNCIHMQFEK